MFRCNLFFILILASNLASAAPSPTEKITAKPKKAVSDYWNVTFSYFSWLETLSLKSPTSQDTSVASFNGLSMQLEKENYIDHFGTRWGGTLYTGQATAGNSSQQNVPYIAASQWFWGVGSYYYLSYRQTAQSLVSVGPFVLYRNIQWPSATGVSSVTSGQPMNGGACLDVKFRMNHAMEFESNIGALASNASTYWSMGFGFKF